MSISSLIGTRLLTGIGALALVGGLAGGTAIAAKGDADKPGKALRHELRDQTKAERDAIEDLRKQLAAEYAKARPNVTKMKQLHERIETKRDAIEDQRFAAFLKMHGELDAAERERVAARMAGKGKRGKGKHGKHAAGEGKPGKDKRVAKAGKDKREAKAGKRDHGDKREAKADKRQRNG
ncbi:hypothetical protein DB30_01587 [Enhygromyxa salina]|uniref:Periplasmic heavy metal sensor n=1 Tax=Enhygromyxa salina TaxID=215803 RepID=A0A0C1Z3T9_9BACT|nr:hypothetical protein [Enhygromyxa salina]KIG12319.1 hypothetical protein DB30_01587 [Enhygromyxa salina]